MAAENILGKLIIEGANRAGGIAGGTPSLGSGLAGGGGGTGGPRSAEMETRGFQKTVKDAQLKAVNFAKEQPKWWTRTFKTLGIQMGLAGILKQSQVFTSTIGAFFQIFGAMVDVMLVPLVKPVLMPLMRWFARQIPTMGRLSKAVFGFLGSTIMAIIRMGKKLVDWGKNTYDWLKDKGEGIWNGIKNMGSIKWWQDSVFKPIWDTITGLPGKIVSGIRALFSWNTWVDIFRNLWSATLGGVKIGKGKFSFTFPTWHGGSTFEMENVKTPGHLDPSLVTVDSDGNVLSVESTGGPQFTGGNIERGFKTGLDKDGNVLEEKYGRNMDKTGKVLLGVWEWMKNTKEGDAPRTLAGYQQYKTEWMGGRGDSRTDQIKTEAEETAKELKEMFDDLHIAIKSSLVFTGVGLTGMYAKDIGNSVTRALGTVTKGVLSPVRAVKGLLDGIMAQFKIGDQKSFIKHLMAGKGVTGAAREALSNFQFGFQPPKAPSALVDEGLGAAFDASTSGSSRMLDAGEEAFGLVDQHGNKLARSVPKAVTHGADVVDNQNILKKAHTLLKNLTSYVLRQLRNIGGILKNPTLVAGVKNTIGRMADEIEALLRPLAGSVPEAQTILAATRVSKSFLLRSLPVVGAAIGFAETAYNINAIARSDLSWIKANETPELARDIERMKASLGMSKDMFAESADLGWGPIDIAKKLLLSKGGTDVAEAGLYQGAGTNLLHTKTGAILTQLLLGTMSTGAGVVGLPGLPISLGAAAAQEVHRMGVLNNDDTIIQGLINSFSQGVQNKDKGLKLQIDGLDAVMDIPGY